MKFLNLTVTFFVFLFTFNSIVLGVKQKNKNQSDDKELFSLLNNIHTMQAKFKQFEINNKGVISEKNSEGFMFIEKPGKFRWEIIHPNKQLIIVHSKNHWFYDEDLAQATKRKVDYQQSGNPAVLLSGTTEQFKQMFKIAKAQKLNNGVHCFELKPKLKSNQNSWYRWIRLYFKEGKLVIIRLANEFDQFIEIYFTNISLNNKISSDKFIFSLPKNVDLIDEEN